MHIEVAPGNGRWDINTIPWGFKGRKKHCHKGIRKGFMERWEFKIGLEGFCKSLEVRDGI